MNNNKKTHRGRIQAQGGGVEESESWAQDEPLKISAARELFRRLIAKLSLKAYKKRKKALEQAQRFAENAHNIGGTPAPKSISFLVRGTKKGERVDIEIITGRAFTKDD